MKKAFTSKASTFLLSFIFLIIIVSFLFSSFDNFQSGSSGGQEVGNVDGIPVTVKEFQMALNQQVEFFNQMMGGNVSQKQLEQMGVKQTVFNNLVQQKLILNAGKKMGIVVSTEEIKEEIKKLEYFKTNNQFDVTKYKNLLNMNGYSPIQFENLISSDLIGRKMQDLFNTTLASKNYAQDIITFKNKKIKVQTIKLIRSQLSPLIEISPTEIENYAKDEKNKKSLQDAYDQKASVYNKPAQAKARHILVKSEKPEDEPAALKKIEEIKKGLNLKNFTEIAKKSTEDPSGKSNGGDLGWFEKGQMVPEFEEAAFNSPLNSIVGPIKSSFGYHMIWVENRKAAEVTPFEKVKLELAKINLQKTKSSQLDSLLEKTKSQLSQYLSTGSVKEIEVIKNKTEAEWYPSSEINLFDLKIESLGLSSEEAQKIIKAQIGSVVDLGNAGTIFLVKTLSSVESIANDKILAEQLTNEVNSQSSTFSRKGREELIKELNSKAKIVTNPGIL
jgi:peptidyl-prolyl cis-trans isomerase D